MSLVRITTDSTDGSFNQTFKEDVFFPPNSKIALNTLSMKNALKGYRIDNSNNKIEVFMSDGTGKFFQIDVLLKHGLLNSINAFNELLDDFLLQLNNKSYEGGGTVFSNSISWRMNASEFDFFGLGLSNLRAGLYEDFLQLKRVEKLAIGGTDFFQSTNTANVSTFINFGIYSVPLNSSKGRFYIQPAILEDSGEGNQTAGAGTNGILIGLIPVKSLGTTIALTDIKYGCYINNVNSTYRTIHNGVETNSGVVVSQIDFTDIENNDFMSLERVGTNFLVKKYSPLAGLTATLATLPILDTEINDDLLPVVIFKGKGDPAGNGAKAKIIAYTPTGNPPNENVKNNPFKNMNITNNTSSSPILTNDPRDVERNQTDITYTLNFESLDTAQVLGFTQKQITSTQMVGQINYVIVSPNLIRPYVNTEYFVVVLDNLKLTAYDGESQSRQNVLAYIPKADDINGVVQYEPNNLYYMALNNKEPLKLRNIRGRILDSELLSIITKGNTTFSFLIN